MTPISIILISWPLCHWTAQICHVAPLNLPLLTASRTLIKASLPTTSVRRFLVFKFGTKQATTLPGGSPYSSYWLASIPIRWLLAPEFPEWLLSHTVWMIHLENICFLEVWNQNLNRPEFSRQDEFQLAGVIWRLLCIRQGLTHMVN